MKKEIHLAGAMSRDMVLSFLIQARKPLNILRCLAILFRLNNRVYKCDALTTVHFELFWRLSIRMFKTSVSSPHYRAWLRWCCWTRVSEHTAPSLYFSVQPTTVLQKLTRAEACTINHHFKVTSNFLLEKPVGNIQ